MCGTRIAYAAILEDLSLGPGPEATQGKWARGVVAAVGRRLSMLKARGPRTQIERTTATCSRYSQVQGSRYRGSDLTCFLATMSTKWHPISRTGCGTTACCTMLIIQILDLFQGGSVSIRPSTHGQYAAHLVLPPQKRLKGAFSWGPICL